MGMTFDPDVDRRRQQALDDFGAGTTGSRVLNGTYAGHKAVEEALQEFYAMDHAMVFSTGYQANLGIISTIAGKGDYIVLDIDSHASIWDGCKMGDAEVVPFKHNDIEAMEKRLKRIPEGGRQAGRASRAYIRCSATSPAQGDDRGGQGARAPWSWSTRPIRWASSGRTGAASPRTKACSTRSTSSSAPSPRVSERWGLLRFEPSQVRDPAGWSAGPTCSPRACRRASSATAATSIRKLMHSGNKRAHLWENSRTCTAASRSGASSWGPTLPQSAIIAVIMPDLERGAAMWSALLHEGLYVNLARPPATPANMTLLRCSLCAEHTAEQVRRSSACSSEPGRPSELFHSTSPPAPSLP
jgi:glycine C-acetyltransferase/8-amino-7-oxononanoate synthase